MNVDATMLQILFRSSTLISFLNKFEFVNVFPFGLVKVHSKLISSNVIGGLIVFSNAKLISIGSVEIGKKFENVEYRTYSMSNEIICESLTSLNT